MARVVLRFGQTVVALVSVSVLAVSYYGWDAARDLDEHMVTTNVIEQTVANRPKPLDGAVDILLVGVDSRTDAQGNPLPREVLDMLHAGKYEGEQNTDTMILVHIPVDGTRAVAISFPRDSYVQIANGFGKHKLNSAFARQRNTTARDLANQGMSDQKQINDLAATEGRKTLIKTIEQLSGGSVTIDRYAEVNLASFYEITKVIGGVEVCLAAPTSDPKSGANFQAGRQTIEGAQALAFVRQRDNLPHSDLDRIVRQQVFIGALANKVLSAGTLANPSKLGELVTAIQKSVILSEGWNVFTFAEQMQGLVGGNIQFQTIPVGPPRDTADGNVLSINTDEVKDFITNLVKDPTAPSNSNTAPASGDHGTEVPNSAITVNTRNSAGVENLARRVLDSLTAKSFSPGVPDSGEPTQTTVVQFPPGEQANAERVAAALPGKVPVAEDPSLPSGQVRVVLGSDFAGLDVQNFAAGLRAPADTTGVNPPAGTGNDQTSATDTPPLTADGTRCVN